MREEVSNPKIAFQVSNQGSLYVIPEKEILSNHPYFLNHMP